MYQRYSAWKSFAEISENLAKYRFENNFVGLSKKLYRILKRIAGISKLLQHYSYSIPT